MLGKRCRALAWPLSAASQRTACMVTTRVHHTTPWALEKGAWCCPLLPLPAEPQGGTALLWPVESVDDFHHPWSCLQASFTLAYLSPLESCHAILSHSFFFFKILFIFLDRGEGMEKEREGNIHLWLPLAHPQPGIWPATHACTLPGNRTNDPLIRRLVLSPLSHTSQGYSFPSLLRLRFSPDTGQEMSARISQGAQSHLDGIWV